MTWACAGDQLDISFATKHGTSSETFLHRGELGEQGVLGFGWSLQAQVCRQGLLHVLPRSLCGFKGRGGSHLWNEKSKPIMLVQCYP